jgi:hypothetical protein
LSNSKLPALDAALVLAILRVALGALFLSTFFENLGKGLYGAKGYAGLIRSYIHYGRARGIRISDTGLWVSEWGIGWIWELLVPMVVAAALTLGPSDKRAAVDVELARRWPQLPI